jgi:superfamily II DNA or RNA helicase
MIVLHGGWLGGRLLLWGETLPRDGAELPAADVAPRPSPFDAGAEALAAAAGELAGSVAAARRRHVRSVIAWLPTRDGWPQPSCGALMPAVLPPGESPAPLRPWRVTALPLSMPEQCAVLGACAAGPRLSSRLRAGRDLRAWSRLWRFAGALAARQSFLPALRETAAGRFESWWLPVMDGAERRRLEVLAGALPPAACCLAGDAAAAHPPRAPAEPSARAAAAREFLEEALDRLVRGAAVTPLTRAHARKGSHSGAHAAWLASLRGDSRRVRWNVAADLRELARALAEWRRPITLGDACGGSLLLRLEEPPGDGSDGAAQPGAEWRLRLLVRRPDGEELPLAHTGEIPAVWREFALTALGQAAAVCPLIDDAADDFETRGARLDTGEAYTFLTVHAPALKAAGFDVEPPSWWRDGEVRAPLRLRARLPAAEDDEEPSRPLGMESLVRVNWEIVLGDRAVSLPEIEALVTGGQPLARLHGRWIAVDRDRLRETLAEWRQRRDRPLTVRELVRAALGAEAPGGVPLDVDEVVARGAAGGFPARLCGVAGVEAVPPPAGFRGELRPYQLRGLAWLAFLQRWGLGACLADDMGLGKTVQSLALFARLREAGESRPVLLVCPMSIIGNWLREAARFTPALKVLAHHGPCRAPGRMLAAAAARHDLVVTSYTLLQRDFAALRRVRWAAVVLDEAQNIKNPATRQSRAARALPADFRLALTGTPVENQAGDLWALMDFLNPGLLGTSAAFRRRFQQPIRTGVDSGARAALRRLAAPFILRRLKSDPEVIADLPERIEGKVFCTLTREQATLYAGELHALEAGLEAADGAARRGLVLATLTRLKQICNHPAHYLGAPATAGLAKRSGKLARLDEMLEEVIAAGDRALVFTQFAVMGELLRGHLRATLGCEVPFLHGGVPRAAREAMVARFQAAEGPPVFVLSLRAGGTGLNLTRASHVFHFDRWWNPAVENQATDRAHRIGQTRNVFVHKFVCAGTLEERIDALLESKTSLAADLVGSGESWLADLSDERLREVLALSADAVAADDGGSP